jgi:hypothetical protein
VKFIREQSLDRLDIAPQEKPIAVHVTCSAQHLGGAQGVIDIVRRCTTAVVHPRRYSLLRFCWRQRLYHPSAEQPCPAQPEISGAVL